MRLCGIAVFISLSLWTGQVHADAKAAAQAKDVKPGQVLFQNLCIHCHGTKGEGNAALKAPPIAGRPDWYIEAQLQNFQLDRRGVHPEDAEGQMMRAIAKALTPQQLPQVAAHVSALSRPLTPAPTASADPAIGKELFEERCMECHRYNGEGELVFRSPPLVGLPDWYLTAQLRKFQKGLRGAEVGDEYGKKMILSSSYVDSEALLQSLVSYLWTLQSQNAGEFGQD